MESRSITRAVLALGVALATLLGTLDAGNLRMTPRSAQAADPTSTLTPDQKAQAKQHYGNAVAAEKEGRLDDALVELQAAYEVTKDPKLFFQLGRVHEQAKHLDEAVIAYRRYLNEAAPSPGTAAEVEATIAGLEAQRAAAAPLADQTATDEGPTPVGAVERLDEPEDDLAPGGWQRTAAWVSVGAAALLLTTGIVLASSANAREDDIGRLADFRDPTTGQPSVYTGQVREQYDDARSEGDTFKGAALVTFIGAGVATAAAVTFFILDAQSPAPETPDQGQARLLPTAGPSGGGLTFTWGF